jgi:hypothetical protein
VVIKLFKIAVPAYWQITYIFSLIVVGILCIFEFDGLDYLTFPPLFLGITTFFSLSVFRKNFGMDTCSLLAGSLVTIVSWMGINYLVLQGF